MVKPGKVKSTQTESLGTDSFVTRPSLTSKCWKWSKNLPTDYTNVEIKSTSSRSKNSKQSRNQDMKFQEAQNGRLQTERDTWDIKTPSQASSISNRYQKKTLVQLLRTPKSNASKFRSPVSYGNSFKANQNSSKSNQRCNMNSARSQDRKSYLKGRVFGSHI